MNNVLPKKTNQNALLRNKKTQIMGFNLTCQNILTPLTYLNVEERFWTDLKCHIKERACPLKEKYTLRRCWILYSTVMGVTAHHFPGRSFKKQLAESWKITSITLLSIILLHKRNMQTGKIRDKLLRTFMQKQ